MKLNELSSQRNDKNRKRVGRGIGSGKGKTSGKGHKGQKARSGVSINGFEGGQMPIYRRLPKRGFNSVNRVSYQLVNIAAIQAAVDAGKIKDSAKIDATLLAEVGLVRSATKAVKLLAKGNLKAKVTITVDKASERAVTLVEKAGGKVVQSAASKKEAA